MGKSVFDKTHENFTLITEYRQKSFQPTFNDRNIHGIVSVILDGNIIGSKAHNTRKLKDIKRIVWEICKAKGVPDWCYVTVNTTLRGEPYNFQYCYCSRNFNR